MEYVDQAQAVWLMYNLLTLARSQRDLSNGLARELTDRSTEITINKKLITFVLGFLLRTFLVYCRTSGKCYIWIRYELTLKRYNMSTFSSRKDATAGWKYEMETLSWYVPYFISSVMQ